jgi:hypothetical protein
MTKTLIGIAGPMRAGKDTLADIIEKELAKQGVRTARVRFSDKLKEWTAHMLDVERELLDDPEFKDSMTEHGVTVRHWLQTLGTEWGRRCIHPDIWVNEAMSSARFAAGAGRADVVIMPDVRFENEAEAVIEAGGKIIEVEPWDKPVPERITWRTAINPAELVRRIWHALKPAHESERGIPDRYIFGIVENIPGSPERMLDQLHPLLLGIKAQTRRDAEDLRLDNGAV